MVTQVKCCKLNETLDKLDAPPLPGALGEKIFNQVSKKAWSMWLAHQTMLINEYRLSLIDVNARQFLQQEMNKYFFESPANNDQKLLD